MRRKVLAVVAALVVVPTLSGLALDKSETPDEGTAAEQSDIEKSQPEGASAEKTAPENPAIESSEVEDTGADPNTGGLMFSGGVDWASSYFFRGYNQEDTGMIIQPYASLGINIVDTDDVDVNAYLKTWNSLHSEQTGGDDIWYESDVIGQIDVVMAGFTISGIYTLYTYPNDAFESIQEFGLQVAYDDSNFWNERAEGFALKPWIGIYKETSDGNGDQDTYGEFGIAPTWTVPIKDKGWSAGDLSIAFPVKLGMSVDDYYTNSDGDNAFFGYVSGGITATLPLPVPAKYGSWNLVGSVEYIQMLADSVEAANDGGTEYEVTGRIGISFSY